MTELNGNPWGPLAQLEDLTETTRDNLIAAWGLARPTNARLSAPTGVGARDALLAALEAATEARAAADRTMAELLIAARGSGASLAQVGAAMGVSKQSVHERVTGGRRPEPPRHTEPMF